MSEVSEVDICNLALQKIGEDKRIVALTDDTKAARELAIAYPLQRDAELRRNRWKFCLARASIAADAAAPSPSVFLYQYALPADFLSLIELTDYRLPSPTEPEQYQFRTGSAGTMIETDLTAPLRIRYVAKITDTTRYDPLFVQALACSIAMQVCEPITQSTTKLQSVQQQYQYWMEQAETVDAIEKPPQPMFDSSWLMERN